MEAGRRAGAAAPNPSAVNEQLKRCEKCRRPRDNADEQRLCPICGDHRLKGYPVRPTFDSSNDEQEIRDALNVLTKHKLNWNVAPFPQDVMQLVEELNHKPNWGAYLQYVDRGQGSEGLTLSVYITEPDAYDHTKPRSVVHYFPVPPAAYDYRSWRRWLFDQLALVDDHERMEHFTIAGEKPYAPSHGPGNNPYLVREVGTEEDRRTSFRGELNP